MVAIALMSLCGLIAWGMDAWLEPEALIRLFTTSFLCG